MNRRIIALVFVLGLAGETEVVPQTLFQNLGFEAAILPLVTNDPAGYNRVLISGALPNWTGWVGSEPQSVVLYNTHALSSAGVGLFGPGPQVSVFPENSHIEGNYTAFLQAGYLLAPPARADASLSQVGMVPGDANSLRLKMNVIGGAQVTLGGSPLTLLPLGSGSNYTLFGADIVAFAGRTAELRITALSGPGITDSFVWLDSIEFSPLPVPEPSTIALFCLGLSGLCFAFCRRTRQM